MEIDGKLKNSSLKGMELLNGGSVKGGAMYVDTSFNILN